MWRSSPGSLTRTWRILTRSLTLSPLPPASTRYSRRCKVRPSPPSPPSPRPSPPSGRLLWLCGAPGLGKSTSAQILGRDHGFVYYEADCFLHLKNPFISLQAPNPSMAQIKQKIMKGKNWDLVRRSEYIRFTLKGKVRRKGAVWSTTLYPSSGN